MIMNRTVKMLVFFAFSAYWANFADAQFAVPIWTQPAPVVIGSPVIVNRPAFVAPPVVTVAPMSQFAPVVVSQPPVFMTPAPVVMSRPPIITYRPTREIVTRNRPILGGSVSRVRYRYRPVMF